MDFTAKFAAVAQMSKDFFVFTDQFFRLAITCPYDDETLKSLFWIGANYHRPVDHPGRRASGQTTSSKQLSDPVAPPPASNRLGPVNLVTPPWLLLPSAPSDPLGLSTQPGSLVPVAPPWSVITPPPPWTLCSVPSTPTAAVAAPSLRTCFSPWPHGIVSVLGYSGFSSNGHRHNFAQASDVSDVTLLYRLSISALGSIGSATVGSFPDVKRLSSLPGSGSAPSAVHHQRCQGIVVFPSPLLQRRFL